MAGAQPLNSRLLYQFRPASRATVLDRLLTIVMMIALLCGSALLPAIAHAHDAGAEHSAEVLHVDTTAATPDSHTGGDSDKSGQTGVHHHCTIALEAEAPGLGANAPIVRATVTAGLNRILRSLAQAPPIEPPAA